MHAAMAQADSAHQSGAGNLPYLNSPRSTLSGRSFPNEHATTPRSQYLNYPTANTTFPRSSPYQMSLTYQEEPQQLFEEPADDYGHNWSVGPLPSNSMRYSMHPSYNGLPVDDQYQYGQLQQAFTAYPSSHMAPHGMDATTDDDASRPRTYPSIDYHALNLNQYAQGYPPSAYQLDQSQQNEYTLSPQATEDISLGEDTVHDDVVLSNEQDQTNGFSKDPMIAGQQEAEDVQSPTSLKLDPDATPITSAQLEPIKVEPAAEEGPVDKDLPYAKLLHRCLLSAPDHTMVLKDIYEWFRRNTDKGKDPNVRGWQNSIRHNLSMNKAFTKVDQPHGPDGKRGYKWKLEDNAIHNVMSTTRYRTKNPHKRNGRALHANFRDYPKRQASGAKGGQATRRHAERLRRSERIRGGSTQRMFDPNYMTYGQQLSHAVQEGYMTPGDLSNLSMMYHDQGYSTPYYGNQNPSSVYSDSSHVGTPMSTQYSDDAIYDDPYSQLEFTSLSLNHGYGQGTGSESGNEEPQTPASSIYGEGFGCEDPYFDLGAA